MRSVKKGTSAADDWKKRLKRNGIEWKEMLLMRIKESGESRRNWKKKEIRNELQREKAMNKGTSGTDEQKERCNEDE